MVYANLADLALLGAPSNFLDDFTDDEKNSALNEASEAMDDSLSARYALPLVSWPASVKRHCVNIALWYLYSKQGSSPIEDKENIFKINYDNTLAFLDDLENHRKTIYGIVDSNDDDDDSRVIVDSDWDSNDRNRGWKYGA